MESETNHEPLEKDLNETEQIKDLEVKDRIPSPFPQQYAADDTDVSGSVYTSSEEEFDRNDGHYSLKRPAEDDLLPRQFKRQKGVLNTDYLDLLNRDIEDAAQRVCFTHEDNETALGSTQIGLTYWSLPEKKLFFEAIARLGQTDLPGIASRIGTKSEVEVNHYLDVLRRARLLRQREVRRPAIEFSEIPAAVELSQQCCHALDEAADAISVRQERKEELREEGKWGECWEITPKIAHRLDKGESINGSQKLQFKGLFNLHTWLRLSERVFMNSSIPSENWQYIDNRPPSMWATTFEDFHSLAVSITKRLVQTTLFMSMSRIRAKRELHPNTRDIVRAQDVQAAIASLGMKLDSRQFWSKCARRLRLEFSAADFPETYRKKEVLKNRITTERRQEQYAEERDQFANWQAENEMWDLLQKKPPIELPKVPEPGPLQRSTMDVEGIFPIGRDWMTKTNYRSEWEQE
ncbi:unnamed protein product [Fusarium graminearum]|nr:unnamed protein product [Fusarium graminearum]